MKDKNKVVIDKHLYIFNLSTDIDNPLLAFTQDWVEAFENVIRDITVISTWVGKHSLPETIQVVQLGGGNFLVRGKSLLRLFRVACTVIKNRKNALVFHHMSTRTAAILGPIFSLFRIKQGLWYSHSNRSVELRFAAKFMNRIFSSTPESLPIYSEKARFVGHGINLNKFPIFKPLYREKAILSLGRIAQIKHNEALIDAVSRSERALKEVHLVGPVGDSSDYLELLTAYAYERGINLVHIGEVPHSDIAELLSRYAVSYTGNPNTVDKSVIEGALCGSFTLASQEFILKQTGMALILEEQGITFNDDLAIQIQILDDLYLREDLRLMLRHLAAEKNSVSMTTKTIFEEILLS